MLNEGVGRDVGTVKNFQVSRVELTKLVVTFQSSELIVVEIRKKNRNLKLKQFIIDVYHH